MSVYTMRFTPGMLLLNILLMKITWTAETIITDIHSRKHHHLTLLFVVETAARGRQGETKVG